MNEEKLYEVRLIIRSNQIDEANVAEIMYEHLVSEGLGEKVFDIRLVEAKEISSVVYARNKGESLRAISDPKDDR